MERTGDRDVEAQCSQVGRCWCSIRYFSSLVCSVDDIDLCRSHAQRGGLLVITECDAVPRDGMLTCSRPSIRTIQRIRIWHTDALQSTSTLPPNTTLLSFDLPLQVANQKIAEELLEEIKNNIPSNDLTNSL